MPQTAAATKAELEKTQVNPAVKYQRATIHITLLVEGVEIKPVEIYEALDTKFGTVQSEKDTTDRNCYIFRVSA